MPSGDQSGPGLRAGRLEVVQAPAGDGALVRDGVDERLQLVGGHPVRDASGRVDGMSGPTAERNSRSERAT